VAEEEEVAEEVEEAERAVQTFESMSLEELIRWVERVLNIYERIGRLQTLAAIPYEDAESLRRTLSAVLSYLNDEIRRKLVQRTRRR
jgi:uncharacterized protein (DUF924 family)